MARSKRSVRRSSRRSSLFSLSARMERVRARRAAGASTDDCGDCPLCVAERSGRTLSVDDFVPRPDGGPPPIYDGAERFLVDEARKALANVDLDADEALHFIHMGIPGKGGELDTASFSVEGDGCIYWTSPAKRMLVARVDGGPRSESN